MCTSSAAPTCCICGARLTSEKNSGRMNLMFDTLTLLTRPLIDLRSASHVSRWYSALSVSCRAVHASTDHFHDPRIFCALHCGS